MSDTEKALIGTWNVVFNQYRWAYTFAEGRVVTWRDLGNGKSGRGKWQLGTGGVTITWEKSTTTETWNLPISPTEQVGQVKSDYANGWFKATKDQTRFDGFAPEGQLDAFACWAASLAWYTKVSPDITTLSQQFIIGGSDPSTWAANGAISINGLMTLSLPNVFLTRSRVSPVDLPGIVAAVKFPMLIGFRSGPMGGHVNVLHSFDSATGFVGVMEPWYPEPSGNKSYDFADGVFFNKTTGAPFKFTGTMTRRPLNYYVTKPLDGQLVIGSRAAP
jgi:hypothetical protein